MALWNEPTDDAIKKYIRDLASMTIAIAGLAFALAEWGYMLMVLGTRIKKHFDKQQRLRELQIRRDALHEWSEWHDRKMDAESRGVPFNEPPPSE